MRKEGSAREASNSVACDVSPWWNVDPWGRKVKVGAMQRPMVMGQCQQPIADSAIEETDRQQRLRIHQEPAFPLPCRAFGAPRARSAHRHGWRRRGPCPCNGAGRPRSARWRAAARRRRRRWRTCPRRRAASSACCAGGRSACGHGPAGPDWPRHPRSARRGSGSSSRSRLPIMRVWAICAQPAAAIGCSPARSAKKAQPAFSVAWAWRVKLRPISPASSGRSGRSRASSR